MACLLLAIGTLTVGLVLGLSDQISSWSPPAIEAAATVLQAVLTLLAIGVAIYVPFREHRLDTERAQRNARLQARSLALAIVPAIVEVRSAAGERRKILDAALANAQTIPTVKELQRLAFSLPPVLVGNMDRTYLLGERAAPCVQTIITCARDLDRQLEQLFPLYAAGASLPWDFVGAPLSQRILIIHESAVTAVEILEPLCHGNAPLSDF